MDLATRGTSTKKHNLCCAFSFWKISGPLEKLTLAQKQLRLKVEMITGKRSEDMHPTKLIWLAETKNLLLQVEILKTEMSDAKQFLIWKHQCGLSDKFDKMTMDIRKKLEDADKLDVEPVAGAVGHTDQQKDDQESSSSSSPLSLLKNCYILLKSARQAAFEIIEAFQDNDVKLIGLVGMGYIGKTDLAILMGINAKESGMFDAVIKVSGRSSEGFRPNLGAIRFEIAKALDPKLNAKEIEKDGSIANESIGGLVKKVEKILIILDDVWEVTDLKAFVIPLGKDHKGCKILLTTRLPHVCQDFGCQKIIHLKETDKRLELDELYWLPVQSVKLGSTAFITFHRSMENEEIDGRLMLNCDYLNDMKSFFKLCSHFPREYAPTVEELTRYGIGQGLFNDYESIESARKKTHSIVSAFRSNLMVEEEEYCVRMCDPFCKLPVFQHTLLEWSDSQKHSYHQLKKLETTKIIFLKTSKYPWNKFFNLKLKNLQTLTIIEDDGRANFYEDRNFGGGSHIVKLNVLCLQAGCFPSGDWAENPPTLSLEGIENFEGLHVLQVKGYKVKGVSSLVKLNKLEILGFIGCTFEDKLPEGLRELQNLKILDFSYCVGLHEQPQKWILKLSKLEELYITDVSLEVWSRSGFLQQLQKLNSYLSLIVLLQEVKSTFRPQQFVVPRFPRYRIELTNMKDGLFSSLKNKGGAREEKEEEVDHFAHFKPISSSKALRIRALPISPFVKLFKDVEYLHLSNVKDCHNIVPSFDEGGLSGLQDLRLHHCEDLQYLIDKEVIGCDLVQVYTFSKLTNLELVGLAKLRSLWNGEVHMINLGNLKSFQLRDCHNLTGYIFPKSIVQSLAQLEIIEVSNCNYLVAVFEQCSVDGRVCLPKLATVKISMVYGLQYVFPSYVTERLPQLTELQVSHCSLLEHVFISSNNEVNEKNDLDHCCHELPQLRRLVLQQLECLKTFCGGKDFIFAPLLEELQVHNCPLQHFTLTLNNDTLPRLKKLCLGVDLFCVSETDAVKVYTKMNKWSTSRPLFIVGTRPFDSLGTCFLSNLKELELGIADLKVLWKDSTIIGLHNLTHLSLNECLRLEYVFTPLSVHNVPHLKCLSIKGCYDLGQIVAEDETTTEAHGQQHRPIWFPNLTDIYIWYCPKLSNVFPARLAGQLPKLKRLRVERMTSLTQIFGPDRDSKQTSNSKVVQLPLLQNLILKGLRSMVRFAPEGLHFTFPALNHLEVRDCTKMQTSFYASRYQGVCAITESVMDYTQPMNAAVAVPIFSGDNYRGWRNKMMTYFKSQDLWEVVALRIKAPLRDAQALFVIQNAVLDPIYSKIIGATSARDAWLTLEKIYLHAIDPYILKPFSGNEQEAKRWSNAKRLEMDADNNVLWPDGGTASEHEKPVIVDLRDPDGLRALDLI